MAASLVGRDLWMLFQLLVLHLSGQPSSHPILTPSLFQRLPVDDDAQPDHNCCWKELSRGCQPAPLLTTVRIGEIRQPRFPNSGLPFAMLVGYALLLVVFWSFLVGGPGPPMRTDRQLGPTVDGLRPWSISIQVWPCWL